MIKGITGINSANKQKITLIINNHGYHSSDKKTGLKTKCKSVKEPRDTKAASKGESQR